MPKETYSYSLFNNGNANGWIPSLAYDGSNKTKRKTTSTETRIRGAIVMMISDKVPCYTVTQRFIHTYNSMPKRSGEGGTSETVTA